MKIDPHLYPFGNGTNGSECWHRSRGGRYVRNRLYAIRLLLSATVTLVAGCYLPLPGTPTPVSDAIQQQVEVTYAIVPRISLASAVVNQAAALAEERKFLSASLSIKHIPGLIQNYSIVVFVHNRSRSSQLFGRLRLWFPGPQGFVDVDIPAISDEAISTYVFDGGNTVHMYKPEHAEKRYEWQWLKAEN